MAKQQATHLLWASYILIQTLVIMSRMYIAAHFPHQCLLGLFLGKNNQHTNFYQQNDLTFKLINRYLDRSSNLWLFQMVEHEKKPLVGIGVDHFGQCRRYLFVPVVDRKRSGLVHQPGVQMVR